MSLSKPPGMAQVAGRGLNNRELDKLVAALGRSKATWRRAVMLHDWLLSIGHHPDDRLCTTLIRHALLLNLYESPNLTGINLLFKSLSLPSATPA